jgi:hypothetical protein
MLDGLAALPPIERAIEAERRLDAAAHERTALAGVRRDALYEASLAMTHAEIAAQLGITRQAVSKAIAESLMPGEDLVLMNRALGLLADLPAVDEVATSLALLSSRIRVKAGTVAREMRRVQPGVLHGDELSLAESAAARAIVILGVPPALRYGVHVGQVAAAWLTAPITGPLAGQPGWAGDMGGGWVWLDDEALESLRGIPAGDEWHLDETDGPGLVFGADRYPVVELADEYLDPPQLTCLAS